MSREVVVLVRCDSCGATAGEDAPVHEGIPITFDKVTREIDLCDNCRTKADEQISVWLNQSRRIVKVKGAKKAVAAKKAAAPRKGGKFKCPTCKETFGTPQGLGAHRSRKHGYRAKR